jgi:hypothetical protein
MGTCQVLRLGRPGPALMYISVIKLGAFDIYMIVTISLSAAGQVPDHTTIQQEAIYGFT